MARDRYRELAVLCLQTVWEELEPFFGMVIVDQPAYVAALDRAVTEIADMLDPEEEFDVVIESERSVPLRDLGSAMAETLDNLVIPGYGTDA